MPGPTNQRIFGSDIIASALNELHIPYACLNPGASYRGLHDSIVNFLDSKEPQIIINLHEEHAVAMAHGYAKVAGKPLIVILHSNVGLMHASMAIFNAWIDRHPMIIIGATGPLDSEVRRPFIDWIHTSQDQGALIRDYIKWDDQPGSPQAAVESIRRGYQIACTPPCGPVYICLDASVQETELEEWPEFNSISRFQPPAAPGVSKHLLKEAADLLTIAKSPLILCGRIARTETAWNERIQLAELLGAKTITNTWQEVGFPTRHPLHVGMTGFFVSGEFKKVHREADLILSLDWFDLGGSLKDAWDGQDIKPKIINCSMDFHQHRGWNKDYGSLAPADLNIPTVPEVLVSELLLLLRDVAPPRSYSMIPSLPAELPKEGNISIRELARAYRNAVGNQKICLISHTIGWPSEESEFNHHLSFLANAGGGGLGAGPGNAVGAALAIKDMHDDCLPIAILGDGDLLMGIQALWTAAHENIPLLIIVANNGSYYNDEMHQEAIAVNRGRPIENKGIGLRIENPSVNIPALASAQGLEAFDPIYDVQNLTSAITAAIERTRAGATVLLDVHITQDQVQSPVKK